MRNTRKVLIAVLVVMTLLVSLAAATIPASAASVDTTVYLTPNSNWKTDNARFAIYTWNDAGEKWISMTYNADLGVYEGVLPAGYTNIIFCRMNPGNTSNSWSTKWNQTADLTLPANGNNHYTVKSGTWDKGGGTWSTIIIDDGTCNHANTKTEEKSATCTEDGYKKVLCSDCGEYTVNESYPANGHTYPSGGNVCSVCNAQAAFTVAGTGAHLGTEWDTTNTANDMTYADGVYTKVYENVAAGSYLLKVARDHDWGTAYPSADKAYTVAKDGSTVTVTLKGTTVTIDVHAHSFSDATCTEPQKCSCGKTQGAPLGHTAGAAATCTAPQTCTVCGAELAATLGHKDENSDYVCDVESCKAKLCTDHSEEAIPGKDATCTATGLTEGKKCSICGEILVAQEEIPTIDHSYETVVTDPTCVDKGYTTYTCVCGDTYKADEIAATGEHTYVDGACSVCGDIDLNNTVTVYFQNNWIWSDVCVYYWYGENDTPNASWPGVKVEKVGNDGTYDIYAAKIPVKVSGVIFNGLKDDGSGERNQTPNITSGWADCLCYYMKWENDSNQVGTTDYHISNADDSDCTTAVTCSVCGGTTTEAKESHTAGNAVKENEVAVSCTVAGSYDNVVYCSVCSKEFSRETVEVAATGHTWENCECANCDAVLTKVELTDSFDFTTADGLAAALASGKIGYTGTFRDNGDSHQFAANSSIQLIVPAYTTVTITGHSTGYGVFDVYVNGVKQDMAGILSFTVIEDTKIVIVPDEEATYSKAYLKGITFEEYVDRTIYEDTTINFGSEGNYKDSIVDFSGIQIGDNGGNNSQVKNGSFDLLLKAGAVVKIHSYPGYTSYQLNGGDEITGEYYTYIAIEDGTLKVTPINGNNYFYSIEIVYHEGVTLVPAKDATCTEAGNVAYYSCTCHAEPLTDKGETAALGHTEVVDAAVAPTCTEAGKTEGKHCSVCNEVLVAQEAVAALGHSYGAAVTAPTCTEAGYTTYTCSACGGSYIADEVAAKGHTEVVDAAVAATCTEAGKTEGKHCSVCNEVLVAQEAVAALGHTEVVDAAVAATCTEAGKTEGKHCSVCNEVLVAQEAVAALGHTEQNVAGKAATCTETGLTDGKKCSVCGTVIVAQSEIPALGHTDDNKDYTCDVCGTDLCTDHTVVTIPGKAATCTETGLTDGEKCSNCGDVLVAQTVIDALGHSYGSVVTAPTCTEAGYTTYTCSACGHSYVADEIAALGHSYDDGVITADPTCTAEGTKTFTCSCGHSYTESISVIAHDYSATVTAPTCTAGGYTTYTCSACGHSYVADEIAALGHSYGAVVTAPTCTEAGYTTYTCSACSHSYVADEVAALTHDMIVDAAVAATCTESGLTEGSHCSRCDHKVEQEVVPALGHTDEDKNYVCDACEAALCTEHTEEVVPGKAATCTESGLTEGKKCSACGEVIVAQTVIDALGHTEVVNAAIAATCTEAGKTEGKHCSVCNEVLVAQTEIAALGHDMQTHTETLPTCTTDGVEAGEECSRCGHKVGFGVIDALGHDFNEGACTRCGEQDPGYVAPEQPDDETPEQPEPELNFFQKIAKAIADFFKSIGSWLKNLFAKK